MAVFAPARPNPTRLRDLLLAGILLYLLAQAGIPALRAFAQDGAAPRVALATTFTYQGRLVQDGIPGDGPYDFQFAVYDNPNVGVGTALGPGVVPVNDLQVANGLFTAQLDFGSGVFTGDKRWLEVRVRPASSTGAYTTLGRNELTATPYALFATSAPWSGISGIPSDIQDGDANTTYTAAGPLSLLGTTFGLSSAGCDAGEVWKWTGSAWDCAPDIVGSPGATYTAASPLALNDTTFGLSTQGCQAGDTWVFNGTGWTCDASAGAHNHFGQSWSGTATNGLSVTNTTGNGLLGTASTTGTAGVKGVSSGTACPGNGGIPSRCIGVYGEATADTDSGVGVLGVGTTFGVSGQSTAGAGVDGVTSTGWGVHGHSTGGGYGVLAEAAGDGYGIVGQVNSTVSTAGWYRNDSGTALYGRSHTRGESAIIGENFSDSGAPGNGIGVLGRSATGVSGQGYSIGVDATGGQTGLSAEGGNVGVVGTASGGWGVWGRSITGVGVVGDTEVPMGTGDNQEAGVVGRALGQSCTNVSSAFQSDFCVGVLGVGTFAGPASIGVSGLGRHVGVRGEATTAGGYGGVFIGKLFHSGAIETTSDARLKTGIGDSAGLEEVLALRPVSFNWIADAPSADSLRHQGLLAQEVQQVLPDLVSEVPAAGVEANLALNYTELIPVLIRAIQEQQAEIDALKAGGPVAAAAPAPGSSDAGGAWFALGLPILGLAGAGMWRRHSR